MKKHLFLVCALALFGASACNDDINVIKQTSLSCVTYGFDDGVSKTHSAWEDMSDFYLFRSEDWSAALFTLTSGEDNASATFTGNVAGTKKGYYAVTPASAVGAILPNGSLEIQVAPYNIFASSENSVVIAPQIGSGKANLTFTSLFGALKFDLSGVDAVTFVETVVANKEHGLYGSYEYNFMQNTITDLTVQYEASRRFSEPLDISSDNALYVALPAGEYKCVELLVRNDNTGLRKLFKAEDAKVERGSATVVAVQSVEVSAVVGCWHMKSYCGNDTDVDLYIDFGYTGNFTILQRTEGMAYTEFSGTYTIDEVNSTISGEYSDGSQWADSYKLSINENFELVLESLSSNGEISVYEMAEMPLVLSSRTVSLSISTVKPL